MVLHILIVGYPNEDAAFLFFLDVYHGTNCLNYLFTIIDHELGLISLILEERPLGLVDFSAEEVDGLVLTRDWVVVGVVVVKGL